MNEGSTLGRFRLLSRKAHYVADDHSAVLQ